MAKTYFSHPRRGVRVWVKIRLRAIAKSTFEISLGATPNLIPTWKTEIFWETQKSIIRLPPRVAIQETHQAHYLSDPIKVIILI